MPGDQLGVGGSVDFYIQGQLTLLSVAEFGGNSNSSKLVTCKKKEDPLKLKALEQ